MLNYVGDGTTWIQNNEIVPPRDLDDEEVERYGGEEALLKSGLYRKPRKTRKKTEVRSGDIE